jgi:hypothetical protein
VTPTFLPFLSHPYPSFFSNRFLILAPINSYSPYLLHCVYSHSVSPPQASILTVVHPSLLQLSPHLLSPPPLLLPHFSSAFNIPYAPHTSFCRGCAHCGRGGGRSLGDGGYETRFEGLKFINSSQRALFLHPNEAFLYDLDGSLTGSNIKENYTSGGKIRGSSMVGTGNLLPKSCNSTNMAVHGTGGSICTGYIFRRVWYRIEDPSDWVGKALCIRSPWQHTSSLNRCQNLTPSCNCVPWLLMPNSLGNVFMVAEGLRYNLQVT